MLNEKKNFEKNIFKKDRPQSYYLEIKSSYYLV